MTFLTVLRRSALGYIALGITTSPAMATNIPVTIGWDETKPDRISVQYDGGLTDLTYEPVTRTFNGVVSVEPNQVTIKTLLVGYSGRTVPLRLKVNGFLLNINFRLSMELAPSCTQQRVIKVGQKVDNASDAMRSVLSAAQLLAIPEPEGCGSLRKTVVQARYDRTIQLSQLSQGLFQIDENVRQAYLDSLPQAVRNSALNKVAVYESQIDGLEAVQLAKQRGDAQEKGNYATASAINDVMLARVADRERRAVYEGEGLTKPQLEKDGRYLDARAAERASPE